MVGGRRVMAAQLDKILEMSALPNIAVQILPYQLGAHAAMESNFIIVELPPPTPGVVFVEGLIGSLYLERSDDLDRYHTVFEQLQSIALNPKDTIDLIASLARSYKDGLEAALRSLLNFHTDVSCGSPKEAGESMGASVAVMTQKSRESDVSN